MVTYEDFMKLSKERIKAYLPKEYRDREIMVVPVQKNNGIVRDGLFIRAGDNGMSPIIYLKPYYERYLDGFQIQGIWKEIAEEYLRARQQTPDVPVNLLSYESVKDQLMVTVCNAERNRGRLADMPHEEKGDLALIYQVCMELPGERYEMTPVRNLNLKMWGISEEQLKTDSWVNMKNRYSPLFAGTETIVEGLIINGFHHVGGNGTALDLATVNKNEPMYVLTNMRKQYGAAYILDEEIMGQIADWLEADLIILPSSIHEAMVIKETEIIDIELCREILRIGNQTQVFEDELLSDEVYRFDRESRQLQLVPEVDMKQAMIPMLG
ncbi:MAG: DUF5688 family protein [Lachnospiraceae bacterium]|nr:DUF5688 family protein [Lachnospiraceae bacterium]